MASKEELHEAAKKLGHEGGKSGGLARAAVLSPQRRREIARMGGLAKAGIRSIKCKWTAGLLSCVT